MTFNEAVYIATKCTGAYISEKSCASICGLEENFDYKKFIDYLMNLPLSFEFIKKFVDFASGFQYKFINGYGWGEPEPDYLELRTKEDGSFDLGIWCEVGGYVIWLSEYEINWRLKTEEEIKREKEEYEKHRKEIDDYYNKTWDKLHWEEFKISNRKAKKIKIKGIKGKK